MAKGLLYSVRRGLQSVLTGLLQGGPWFRLWLHMKSRKLGRLYQKSLLQSASQRVDNETRSPAVVPARELLRRLLFICDSSWERQELLPELKRICEVTFIDVHGYVKARGSADEELDTPKFLSELAKESHTRFDAILVYLRASLLSEELLGHLKKTWHCPVFGYNLDCKTTFEPYSVFRAAPANYRRWAKAFECNLTSARAMLDIYAGAGLRVLYVPPAYHYDPAVHKVRSDMGFEIGLSFLGSWKPEREEFIEKLARAGVAVEMFGRGWKNQTYVEHVWPIYQRSQLNLGLGYNLPSLRTTNLKNRDFECPGAGGCYLTTYDWELAGLVEVGKEILCYRSVDDLIELYSYYIRRPEECLRIATAGFERCVREHTWEQRFRRVFEQLGFQLGPRSK